MGDAELPAFLSSISSSVEQTARRLPSYRDYVRKYCAA